MLTTRMQLVVETVVARKRLWFLTAVVVVLAVRSASVADCLPDVGRHAPKVLLVGTDHPVAPVVTDPPAGTVPLIATGQLLTIAALLLLRRKRRQIVSVRMTS
jgi:hypothetical protein